jgi:hypothetical protein
MATAYKGLIILALLCKAKVELGCFLALCFCRSGLKSAISDYRK